MEYHWSLNYGSDETSNLKNATLASDNYKKEMFFAQTIHGLVTYHQIWQLSDKNNIRSPKIYFSL